MRLFITGTDTGVGKTRVTAAFARALASRAASRRDVTIVKLAQTGVDADEPGDAEVAGALAGCASRELHRFRLPADPWTAALAEARTPLDARALSVEIERIAGDLVIEGSGGVAVPINTSETLADVAAHARARAIVVVGLRLGCINHATLTLEYLARREIPVACVVYTEPWEPVDATYRDQVRRALAPRSDVASCTMPFDRDAARSVTQTAATIATLLD